MGLLQGSWDLVAGALSRVALLLVARKPCSDTCYSLTICPMNLQVNPTLKPQAQLSCSRSPVNLQLGPWKSASRQTAVMDWGWHLRGLRRPVEGREEGLGCRV